MRFDFTIHLYDDIYPHVQLNTQMCLRQATLTPSTPYYTNIPNESPILYQQFIVTDSRVGGS